MRKVKISLAVAAAVVTIAVSALLFMEFDAPRLGQRVLDAAGAEAGIDLEASGFRFNIRRGIVLEDVVAQVDIPSGAVTARLERVVLEHRLWPLLRGDIVVDRLLLENPLIEVRSLAEAAPVAASGSGQARIQKISWGQETAPSAGTGRNVEVHLANLVDATLVLYGEDGEQTTRVEGLDAELSGIALDPAAASAAIGLVGAGHVDVGTVHFADRLATGNRAALSINNGVYDVAGLQLTAEEGLLNLERLVVDLRPDPYTFETTASGEDIDLNRLLNLEGSTALGPARVELEARGAGPDTAAINGGGRVVLSEGRIPDAPALQQVADLIGINLAGVAYEGTTIEFSLGENQVFIDPFEIISEAARVQGVGAVTVDRVIEARAQVSLPRENINLGSWQGDFADGLTDALTDEDGWTSIPLVIGGTVDEPQVRPDSDALLVALQETAGRSLGNWLRGIIKRR